MANIQVKNVSEAVHKRLRRAAKQQNKTLGEVILNAIAHELARAEFAERLTSRAPTKTPLHAAELLDDARHERRAESRR